MQVPPGNTWMLLLDNGTDPCAVGPFATITDAEVFMEDVTPGEGCTWRTIPHFTPEEFTSATLEE